MGETRLPKREKPKVSEPFLLLFPIIILLALFIVYPLFNTVVLAFQNYNLAKPKQMGFNGVDNFITIFKDPYFVPLLTQTCAFVFITVSLQFVLGLCLALALQKPFRGRNIYQAIVFLPWSVSGLVIGFSFKWLFNAEYGPINDLLLRMGLINQRVSFFASEKLAMMCIIVAMVWYGVPFFGIMLSAAFQSIPTELYEAVSIDGGGSVRKLISITLPLSKPVIVSTLLLRTIWVFNTADVIQVMTKGGPANSTHTLTSYMFSKAYSSLDFGQAAALGLLVMAGLVIYALIYMRATKYTGSE